MNDGNMITRDMNVISHIFAVVWFLNEGFLYDDFQRLSNAAWILIFSWDFKPSSLRTVLRSFIFFFSLHPRHITRLFSSHCFSSSFLSPACFLSVVQSAHLFLFVQFVITVFHRAAFIALLLCFITAQINWKWNHKPIAARPEAIYVRGNIICWSSFRELLPGKCARCLSALQIIHAFLQVVW